MNKWLLAGLGLTLVLAVADLFVVTASILLLVFAGILFGVFLNALSRWLAGHTPLTYFWSYLLWVSALSALLALGIYSLGANIAMQTRQLSGELQSATELALEQLRRYRWMPDAEQIPQTLTQSTQLLPTLAAGARWLMWGLTGSVVILFVGLYVAYDPQLYETGLIKLVPRGDRARAAEVMDKVRTALTRWIIGRLISMTIVGVLTAVGLWLLGVPLPMTLGVLAAVLTFVPNFGPVIAAVPQALLALQVDTRTVWYVILLNLALQGVESYLITPMVQRYEVSLPPALTITMQLLLGATLGVIGLMMAAPLTATLMVLIQTLYIRDTLGDPSPGRLASD